MPMRGGDGSLAGHRVVEAGDRIAVSLCGALLAALGAEVAVLAPATPGRGKWSKPALAAAGKRLVVAGDAAAALDAADVVLVSRDLSPLAGWTRGARQILCDVTAHGGSGPSAGRADEDALVQALTGLVDTTGDPAAAPVPIGFPVLEALAALYAAAGVQAALAVRARDGHGQDVAVALYDCAFSTLTTYLPFHFVGERVTRSGNRHVLTAPWNAYRAQDGWLIVCTATDEQWRRLAAAMGTPALGADERFRTPQARMANLAAVDALVASWIAGRAVAAATAALQALGIACGPILPVRDLAAEPNLVHRGAVPGRRDPGGEHAASMAGPLFRAERWPFAGGDPPARAVGAPDLPLRGCKVVEIGQFTTAPLAARLLAAMGAEVVKIEPPGGDATRFWKPNQDGQSYFFALSNTGKRSLRLDLRDAADRARLETLLGEADVLVENLKPGSLDRLGLGAARLRALNPRLVYCAISGFGAASVYPGRPAFDTIVQAMCGIMDLCRGAGTPYKTGISIADIAGGLVGVLAVLDALARRARDGGGSALDVSMQDAGAWLTQWCWSGAPGPGIRVLPAADGYVVALGDAAPPPVDRDMSRAALVAALAAAGIPAAPVRRVDEVVTSRETAAAELLPTGRDGIGRAWPILASPIRLSLTPLRAGTPIGPLGEANDEG